MVIYTTLRRPWVGALSGMGCYSRFPESSQFRSLNSRCPLSKDYPARPPEGSTVVLSLAFAIYG